MEHLDIVTRRDVKAGDVFRAYTTATEVTTRSEAASSPSTAVALFTENLSDVDQILAAVRVPAQDGEKASMFRGHDAFSGRSWPPYHWGVSLRHSCSRNKHEDGKGQVDQMENIQTDVMDAIHEALSKEALIKKLIIPFNETFENKHHALSFWEWQKNTALLELEHRNQQLQRRLREAVKEVATAQSLAEHDRKCLEEALKKGKEELYLLGRAEAMRARIMEQKRKIATRHMLHVTLFSWQRFCHCRHRAKTLKKMEHLWCRLTLAKSFKGFVFGCENMRRTRKLQDRGVTYFVQLSLRHCYQRWCERTRKSLQIKENMMTFNNSQTVHRLEIVFELWQELFRDQQWKKIQVVRATRIWSSNILRQSWQQWDQCTVSAKDKYCASEQFFFRKVILEWRRYVMVKLQRNKRLAICAKLGDPKLLETAFRAWNNKLIDSRGVTERLTRFWRRCQRRLQQIVLTRWDQQVLRSKYLRTLDRMVQRKAERWLKQWGFRGLKRRWMEMKTIQRLEARRVSKTKLSFIRMWSSRAQCWKEGKIRMQQIVDCAGHRRKRRVFSAWMVFTAEERNRGFEKAIQILRAKVHVVETDLQGAKRVRQQLDALVLETEEEKEKFKEAANIAMARTPAWTSGFLDVELRWRTPSLDWMPPPCAGHSAVSLPGKYGTQFKSRVVLFGGYNGEDCFNHVFIFDTGKMQWSSPTTSAVVATNIPPAMQTHTACAFGKDKMLVFGGYDCARELSELFLLTVSADNSTIEWSQPQIAKTSGHPGPFCQHTSCLYPDGQSMIVFGGYRSKVGLLNELWVLDLHTFRWFCPEYCGTPPSTRRGHGAAIIGTKMYVFGGYNGIEHSSDIHALEIETMTWECIEPQGPGGPSPRRQHAVAAVGQHLVIFGGYNGQRYLGDIFSFDTVHRRWKRWPDWLPPNPLEEVGPGRLALGRSMHTMVEAGNRLVAFGGVHEWGALQDMVFLENAAAVDGMQLQNSYVEEIQRAGRLQARVTEFEEALAKSATELSTTQSTLEQTTCTLQMESEKRKKAVRGHRVLKRKLHNARGKEHSLLQTCNRLKNEIRRYDTQLSNQKKEGVGREHDDGKAPVHSPAPIA